MSETNGSGGLRLKARLGRDAQGRRDHGRHQRRAGGGGGEGGRHLGDGAGTGAGADPRRRRGGAHGVAAHDPRDHGHRFHPGHGQGPHGHFAEAQVLEALGVDYIDESEVLTPADEEHHVDKHAFKVPFVCGARNLGEALRRIAEGAAMIRTKGEAGTGDVVHAVKHIRQIVHEMKLLTILREDELMAKAKEWGAPFELVRLVAREGKLPVPNFSAGGIATPADAALVMQLGAEAVFVGSGIFMKEKATPLDLSNPQERDEAERRARAIVKATTHFDDPKILLEASEELTGTMKGLAISTLAESELLQKRGW